MKRGFLKRALAAAGVAAVMSGTLIAAAPAANASPVEVNICPEGWYGAQVGYQTTSGTKYVTVCVQL